MQHQGDRRINNFKDVDVAFAQAANRTLAKTGGYLLQKEKYN
jgi:hypothetical protein